MKTHLNLCTGRLSGPTQTVCCPAFLKSNDHIEWEGLRNYSDSIDLDVVKRSFTLSPQLFFFDKNRHVLLLYGYISHASLQVKSTGEIHFIFLAILEVSKTHLKKKTFLKKKLIKNFIFSTKIFVLNAHDK